MVVYSASYFVHFQNYRTIQEDIKKILTQLRVHGNTEHIESKKNQLQVRNNKDRLV